MNHWWLLFLLNLPLLQEVTRKYLIYSDLVFLGADILLVGTAILLGIQGKISFKNLPPGFLILSALFIAISSVNHMVSGNHNGMFGIGIRATFLPLCYMLVSYRYITTVSNGSERIFICANSWILIIGVMALLQIFLGRYHPINSVWGTTALGIGDYTTADKGVLIPGMFRPTSIFTHTGKFGQVIFTLVFFKWCYLLFSKGNHSRLLYLFMLFDLIIIFTSGQRGALIFLIFAITLILIVYVGQHGPNLKKVLVPGSIILVGFFAAWVVRPSLVIAVYERFVSVIASIPIRLEGNFWLPISTMLEKYLFSGEGLGSFTFGSRLFGGSIVYEVIKMEGFGESSLIRLCVEVGVLAAIIIVLAFLVLISRAFVVSRLYRGTPFAAGALFFAIWTISLMLWANTADVFGNSVVTTLGYAFSGATLSGVPRDAGKILETT